MNIYEPSISLAGSDPGRPFVNTFHQPTPAARKLLMEMETWRRGKDPSLTKKIDLAPLELISEDRLPLPGVRKKINQMLLVEEGVEMERWGYGGSMQTKPNERATMFC
jgi:hypothetical protein